MSDFQQDFIKVVIEIYGLELDDREIDEVLSAWMRQYDSTWILKAIVESLYRGRYKIVCVESILSNWQRLGNPRYQFTPEYEREILAQIPEIANRKIVHGNPLIIPPTTDSPDLESTDLQARIDPPVRYHLPKRLDCESLNPEESAPFQSPYPPRLTIRCPPDPSDLTADSARAEPPDPSDKLLLNQYPADLSLPSTQQSQQRDNLHRDRHNRIERDRHSFRPVNRKLFTTLKAIVDPNHQHKLEYDANNSPSSSDRHVTKIAHFKMPIEHTNEELQF
jgi:hypothetical protein